MRDASNTTLDNRWKEHDVAQLVLPAEVFSSQMVGFAHTGALCNDHMSVGVIADQSDSKSAATTGSHELAHTFGLSHDTNSCDCKLGCIMTPLINDVPPMYWSNCSKISFTKFLPLIPCINDTPSNNIIYGQSVCGNSIVESGEDCDCGDQKVCPCCNPKTCRYLPGKNCSDGLCCSKCKIQAVGSRCRAQTSDCDLPEYCNGIHSYCPRDDFMTNGVYCAKGNGMCFNGSCQHPDDQCKMLWGSNSISSPTCMEMYNIMGKSYGYCTIISGVNETFVPCSKTDSICGKQHCVGGSDKTKPPQHR